MKFIFRNLPSVMLLVILLLMIGDGGAFELPKLPDGFTEKNLKTAATIGEKVIQASRPMSVSEEVELGREISSNLLARYGLYDEDAQLVRYINLVGQTLARYTSRSKEITYRFAVLNSEAINAFAAPGGYVFVTKGALNIIRDESMLAAVLAHEISHIDLSHIPKAIKKSNLISAGTDVAGIFARDKEMASKITAFSTDILFKGYSRHDEKEADEGAVDLLVRCGYSTEGLKNFIKVIKEQKSGNPKFLVIMRTHPNPDDRLKIIDDYLMKKNYPPADGAFNKERFEKNVLAGSRQ